MSAVKTQLTAYVIIGLFVLIERKLRQGPEAQTLEELPSDRGTTRLIGAAFASALTAGLMAPLLSRRNLGRIPNKLFAQIGIALMLTGLVVRIWSARTLGRFYTRTLRVTQGQSVITDGPYRWVRHPGYAADIAMWFGFGLASHNAVVASAVLAIMFAAYTRRIAAEETMLHAQLGAAYADYAGRTSRLVPGLY